MGIKGGPASYDMISLRVIVLNVLENDALTGFQVLLRRKNAKDEMVFRIASQPQNREFVEQ